MRHHATRVWVGFNSCPSDREIRPGLVTCEYCGTAVSCPGRCESCGAPARLAAVEPTRNRIDVTHLRSPQGKREYVEVI
jgi:hypothetical protein